MGTIKRTFANSLTGTGKLSATNLDSNIPAANIADASVTNVSALSPSLGSAIPSVASDPPSPTLGDIWYNSSTGKLKNYGFAVAAWASGGNINTSRSQLGGAGTKSAGLVFGGSVTNSTAPSATNGQKTELYDGTSWSEVNDKSTHTRQQCGFGTQTAAVSFGGYSDGAAYQNGSEEFDGTNWTSGGNYPVPISNGAGGSTGTQTAGLNAAGYASYSANTNLTAEYDGTSWTAGGNLPYSAQNTTNFGTQTAAVSMGGNLDPGISTTTAEYNGSSWTAVNNMLVPAQQNGRVGTQTDGMIFGGYLTSAYQAGSYLYDGTDWSSNPASLSTARGNGGPSTSQGSIGGAFMAGGDVAETTTYTATEEFTAAAAAVKTVTTS